jgi:hypothetical protein
MPHFACTDCGSPSIEPPRTFADSAPVHCKGCGQKVATWGELRRRALEAILAEASRATARPLGVSPDPL